MILYSKIHLIDIIYFVSTNLKMSPRHLVIMLLLLILPLLSFFFFGGGGGIRNEFFFAL